MKNSEEFAIAEETNETAAPGAIDVSENKEETGILAFDHEIRASLPALPDTFMINGVSFNVDAIQKAIDEVKKMKIDGLGDKAGYDAAVEKLKEIKKLRTTSATYYTNTMKPVNALKTAFKAKIDKGGEICKDGEKYLEEIIEPIERAVELARIAEEERKDALAETRAAQIVEMGGVFDGKGTYQFPHDGAIFILASSLRALSDEDYEKEIVDIKAAWDTEVARIKAIEDEKFAAQNKLLAQLEDVNAERTEFRKEFLDMKGYVFDPVTKTGYYNEATNIIVTEGDILTLNAAEWKALLNPAPPVAIKPEVEQHTVGALYTSPEPQYNAPTPFSPPTDLSAQVKEEVVAEAPKVSDFTIDEPVNKIQESKVMYHSVPLLFNRNENPFMTLPITAKMIIHIYPEYFSEEATGKFDVAFTGDFGDSLKYSIIRIPQ